MSHNAQIYNGSTSQADGTVSTAILNAQTAAMSTPAFNGSSETVNNGHRFPFIFNASFCRIATSGVTVVTATAANTPFATNQSSYAEAFTINNAGTYLLKANPYFTFGAASGSAMTCRWRDTLGNNLGPKTRLSCDGSWQYGNIVYAVITITSPRTVFVSCSEKSGTVTLTGQANLTFSWGYLQILKLTK